MNGKSIYIKLEGNQMAGTKSDKIQTKCETIKRSSATQQKWDEYVAGRCGWGFNTSFIAASGTVINSIRSLLNVGQSYTIYVCEDGSNILTGTALLTTCEITATRGNLAQGAFTFVGNGELRAVST